MIGSVDYVHGEAVEFIEPLRARDFASTIIYSRGESSHADNSILTRHTSELDEDIPIKPPLQQRLRKRSEIDRNSVLMNQAAKQLDEVKLDVSQLSVGVNRIYAIRPYERCRHD
jgi:hypothetical protein